MASRFQARLSSPSSPLHVETPGAKSSLRDLYASLELQPGARTVRMLDLHPPSSTGQDQLLEGTLRVVRLESTGHFESYFALSYVWGTKKPDDDAIFIKRNGHNIPITRNCHDALTRLSTIDGQQTIWVDSICIDQSNEVEREH